MESFDVENNNNSVFRAPLTGNILVLAFSLATSAVFDGCAFAFVEVFPLVNETTSSSENILVNVKRIFTPLGGQIVVSTDDPIFYDSEQIRCILIQSTHVDDAYWISIPCTFLSTSELMLDFANLSVGSSENLAFDTLSIPAPGNYSILISYYEWNEDLIDWVLGDISVTAPSIEILEHPSNVDVSRLKLYSGGIDAALVREFC